MSKTCSGQSKGYSFTISSLVLYEEMFAFLLLFCNLIKPKIFTRRSWQTSWSLGSSPSFTFLSRDSYRIIKRQWKSKKGNHINRYFFTLSVPVWPNSLTDINIYFPLFIATRVVKIYVLQMFKYKFGKIIWI